MWAGPDRVEKRPIPETAEIKKELNSIFGLALKGRARWGRMVDL
jgi:hypothetical protein